MDLTRFSLILTIISLTLGGFLLLDKVPIFLSIGTFSIVVILIVSLFLIDKITIIKYILLILAILGIIVSSLSNPHIKALEEIGKTLYISTLDVLMVLGFYVGPTLYIISIIKENLKRRRY
ncbi:hypothetical protein [Saccharolobus caldissimus]|uniref:Uncharacterized protein n=1 Tax=Saccharolobus caldissimus TaxID=1702097 RepID=A0AAQ4CWI3_9CREN|nr:hypothetical protein [Saccharolobus caldissimus]BDC00165.1 hypothetical protein SACC_31810 [Saccharolobus caldissimus]